MLVYIIYNLFFYTSRPTAFFRDVESCDIMLRILQPLSGISFNLATNAAILNTWTQTPLILSGTWVPAKFEHSLGPVLSATDVASTFMDHQEAGVAIAQTPLSDQMFDLILGSTPETRFILDGIDGTNGAESKFDFDPSPIPIKTAQVDVSSQGNVQPLPSNEPVLSPPRAPATSEQKELNKGADATVVTSSTHEPVRRPSEGSTSDSVLNRSISLISDNNEYRNLLYDWEGSEAPMENLPAFLINNQSSSPSEKDPLLQQTSKEVSQDCLNP